MRLKTAVLLLGLTLSPALLAPRTASACPNCKEAVASQPNGEATRLKTGYYYSILLMMAMPFALLGTGAFFVHRAIKRGAMPEF